ncbi:hypothetical protein [Polyangium sp. y55x31]|uniref:hypothetical protein n=1 Tax=Polyangium sp. y55x31 TaxID=3042688 RepID=UPI0024830B2F|nr:hypothetical protein [Polyangium sp. y55x31]MDI1476841.1 hypothetical protein [Polyangium sp. y55x31]
MLARPALTQAPLAAELASTDGLHDGFGTAIHYTCLAVEAHPTLPAGTKLAAQRIRETFIPQLAVLRRPYADEAAAALDTRKQLDALAPDPEAITTPCGGEGSPLPAGHEASLFAYIDKLSADRTRAAMQSGAPPEAAPLSAQA